MPLILRGHHLLCLKGYQGYGYDEDFVKNMSVINNLRKNENTNIVVVDKPDDICKFCPNLKNNICENQSQNKRIIKKDNEVLSKLDPKKIYNSKELFEEIDFLFNTKKVVDKICLECNWHSKCLFYQNLE
ncbi:MAG: DUF1284 domain-containing protein [archaeon]|nr:DUF1284 domain-containing protein [archaeon]